MYLRKVSRKYYGGSAAAPVDDDGRCKTEIADAEITLCCSVNGSGLDGIVDVLDEVDGLERVYAEAADGRQERYGHGPAALGGS